MPMHVLLTTDADSEDLVRTTRAALPEADAFLILLHLRLVRSAAGQAIIEMLGEAPRRCFVSEQLVRYRYNDGTTETSAVLGVSTSPGQTDALRLFEEMAPESWLHLWPSDRPLPTPETAVVEVVHVNDLED